MYQELVAVVLLAGLLDTAFGCNGYKANVVKIENCAGPDAIITVDPDFSVKLNKKCELVPTGCVSNKAFGTALAHFTLKKDKIVIKEGDIDLCQAADEANKDAKNFMKVFSVPEKCPVAEEKICANDHRLDLSKYKNMMAMAKGNIIMDAQIDHDTGKSCVHIELEITK